MFLISSTIFYYYYNVITLEMLKKVLKKVNTNTIILKPELHSKVLKRKGIKDAEIEKN